MGKFNGRASYELLLVMILLILFSVSTLTLVSSGSDAYIATVSKTSANSDIRVASSYIYTKCRQNMEKNGIRIATLNGIEGQSLVISESLEGALYDTVIFVHEGSLREAIISPGTELDPESSFEISRIDRLELEENQYGIDFRLIILDEDGERVAEGFISTL